MRTSEERVEELRRRVSEKRREKERRGLAFKSATVFAVCFAFAVAAALVVAAVPAVSFTGPEEGIAGSIVSDHGALGYIMVAVLSFSLGAFVVALCFRLRKRSEENSCGDDRKN